MLSRRRFLAGIAASAGAGFGGLASPIALHAAGVGPISATQRRVLLAALEQEDRRFDPFAKMLVSSLTGVPGHHTTLRTGDVHATRASLIYAAALLDAGERWRTQRAREILRAVIALQDQDPASKTYGLWPWFLEEPLAKMSPPDWNWADFCAVPLLMAWIGHREILGNPLADELRHAIIHAARSIERRDVGPGQTHAAVLGTGVTLLAAQELKLGTLRVYAKARLRRLHDHLIQQGSFTEYNSPAHTTLMLQELSRMLWLVKDGRDKSLISALHDLAWKHVATHFHPPTCQWAGPHSQNRETNLRKQPAILAFLQAACDGRARLIADTPLPLGLEAYRMPLQCPRKWVKLFARLESPRQVIETFVQPEFARAGARTPVIGTTWLHPRFALGSVNRGDFWRQRRPFLAYWGAAESPRYLQLRCLKNGADFASALLFAVQHEGAVLAVVTFATDHGDTHPSLDPIKDSTIALKDLRLRFEFGGEPGQLTATTAGEAEKYLVIQDTDVRFILRPVADGLGMERFRWDTPDLKLVPHLDSVAYAGAERIVNLAGLNEAFVCFTLEEWPYDQPNAPLAKVTSVQSNGRLRARWSAGGKTLDLDAPTRPASFDAMNDSFRGIVA